MKQIQNIIAEAANVCNPSEALTFRVFVTPYAPFVEPVAGFAVPDLSGVTFSRPPVACYTFIIEPDFRNFQAVYNVIRQNLTGTQHPHAFAPEAAAFVVNVFCENLLSTQAKKTRKETHGAAYLSQTLIANYMLTNHTDKQNTLSASLYWRVIRQGVKEFSTLTREPVTVGRAYYETKNPHRKRFLPAPKLAVVGAQRRRDTLEKTKHAKDKDVKRIIIKE